MGMPVEEKAPKSFEEMEANEVATAPVSAETAPAEGDEIVPAGDDAVAE